VFRYDCSIVATMEKPTLQEHIEARQRSAAREGETKLFAGPFDYGINFSREISIQKKRHPLRMNALTHEDRDYIKFQICFPGEDRRRRIAVILPYITAPDTADELFALLYNKRRKKRRDLDEWRPRIVSFWNDFLADLSAPGRETIHEEEDWDS
jgi:hypothetical protein